jgi:hypothetical protein
MDGRPGQADSGCRAHLLNERLLLWGKIKQSEYPYVWKSPAK